MRKAIFLLLIAAAILGISTARDMTESERLRYQYFAMEGMRQRQKGNAAEAVDLFKHALSINPDADELLSLLASYYSGVDDSLYLDYTRRAIALNPSNPTYRSGLGAYYIHDGQYDEAIRIFEEQYKEAGDKESTLDILFQLYEGTKRYDEAIDVLDRLDLRQGKSLSTAIRRIRMYELKDDTTATYQALKSLAEENDDEALYKTMLGNWLVQKGRGSEAGPYLEAAMQQAPDDYDVLMSVYDYYNSSHQDSLAQQIADRVLRSPNTPSKDRAKFMGNCMRNIYNQKPEGDTIATYQFFDRLIEQNPNDSLAYYMKISLMQTFNEPSSKILPVMDQYFRIVPDDPEMRLYQTQLFTTEEDWANMQRAARMGQLYTPDELVFYYLEALSLLQTDRDRDAAGVIKKGLRSRGDHTNNELVADAFGLYADLQYKMGNRAEAFQSYDSCLTYQPDNTAALNNYAYYLSLMNQDLKKAELMSYKTVAEEPNNATYLDTYAWILFQQGRYDDAQTYIDRTLTVIRNDAKTWLINNHKSMLADSMEQIEDTVISEEELSQDTTIAYTEYEGDTVVADTVNVDEIMGILSPDYTPTEQEIDSIVYSPNNATLFEHAGDISYMNGQHDKALELWLSAALCSEPDKTLQKKIRQGKYIPRKKPKL